MECFRGYFFSNFWKPYRNAESQKIGTVGLDSEFKGRKLLGVLSAKLLLLLQNSYLVH